MTPRTPACRRVRRETRSQVEHLRDAPGEVRRGRDEMLVESPVMRGRECDAVAEVVVLRHRERNEVSGFDQDRRVGQHEPHAGCRAAIVVRFRDETPESERTRPRGYGFGSGYRLGLARRGAQAARAAPRPGRRKPRCPRCRRTCAPTSSRRAPPRARAGASGAGTSRPGDGRRGSRDYDGRARRIPRRTPARSSRAASGRTRRGSSRAARPRRAPRPQAACRVCAGSSDRPPHSRAGVRNDRCTGPAPCGNCTGRARVPATRANLPTPKRGEG